MRSRVVGLLVGPSLLSLVLTGCGSGDTARPTSTSSLPAPASPASPEPPATASPTPSEPEAEMTGPVLTLSEPEREVFRFTLPKADWDVTSDGQSGILSLPSGAAVYVSGSATLADAPVGDGYYYRNAERALPDDQRQVRRVADRTVAGVEGAVFESAGPRRSGLYYFYVARHQEALLSMRFEFPRDTTKARAWIEAVLASGEWL